MPTPCIVNGATLSKFSSSDESPSGEEVLDSTFKPLSVLLLAGLFPGHLFPLVSLGEELVRRGHRVTLCANVMNGSRLYPEVPERVGIRFVSAGYDATLTQDGFDELHIAMQTGGMDRALGKKLLHIGHSSHINIRAKVEEMGTDQFDIIICEGTTLPAAVYFHRKEAKIIILGTQMITYPSIMPEWSTPLPNLGQTDDLSFLDRLVNAILLPFLPYLFREIFQSVTRVDASYREGLEGVNLLYYPGLRIPLIVTTVFGLDYPKPRQPLVEFVGPILITSLPPLGEDVQAWLDAKEEKTVIYISMGTTGSLTQGNARALLSGVMGTTYSALWVIKAKNREMFGQVDFESYGDRLFLMEWAPQQTVLQHSAIFLSILHCGLNGIQESLYNSLPVICVPFGYDHYEIAAKISSAGVGISLLSLTDTMKGRTEFQVESVSSSIYRVVNEDFAKNASRVRQMFKIAGGGQRAADLVEFYEEFGFDHLLPSFVKYEWNWVQYYNADVWLVLGLVCGVLGWLLWRVCCSWC